MVTLSQVVSEREHDSVREAQEAAHEDATSSGGRVFPCVVFRQGGRVNISTAFPFSFVAKHVKPDSAVKGGDPRASTNRPMLSDHVTTIKNYLIDNKDAYILPPVTLNVRQTPQIYVPRTNAAVRSGFLVVPDETVFYVTDGQHRIAAIAGHDTGKTVIPGILKEDPERGTDGLAVLIVVEPDLTRVHQDFADAAQTKQIPPSLLAAYNLRQPVNRVLHRIVNDSELLRGRVDETSKTLPKMSQNLFLLNQVRGFLKALIVGDFGMADDAFLRNAGTRLGASDRQDLFVRETLQFLAVLTDKMDPWNRIVHLPRGGSEANQIPDLRQTYLNMTATGLVIAGQAAFEINKMELESDRVQAYVDLATKVDWKRSAPIWRGSVMSSDGKLVTGRQFVKAAGQKVIKVIGLHPHSSMA